MALSNAGPAGRGSKERLAVLPLASAQLIIALDIYIVFVALPNIASRLGFSHATLQWVISSYAIAFGGLLMLGGRVADMVGKRRLFLTALGVYAGSSALGGLAQDPAMIVSARALQGVGGAFLFPTTLALVNTLHEEGESRNRALAIWSAGGASGLTLGSLLGGILTSAFGWRAVFFVNVPLAMLIAVLGLLLIPPDSRSRARQPFDLPGALTGTAGVASLVFTLVEGPATGWTSPPMLATAGTAIALLACFAAIQTRSPVALMPIRLLRHRRLARGITITFAFMATLGTLPYFLTLLFQDVEHLSALETGLAFLPFSVAIAVGTQAGGRMTERAGTTTTLILGFASAAIGTGLIAAHISARGHYAALLPGLLIMGAGQGVAWTAMWITIASGVEAGQQGIASGIASTAQQVGYAVGLAILVAIANASTYGLSGVHLDDALASGTRTVVYVIAGGILLTAAISATIGRRLRTAV